MNQLKAGSRSVMELFEAVNHSSLANRLADDVAEMIGQSIDRRGRAIVAFSGGSTPKPLFNCLCQRKIDWSKVIITLVDERWVPQSNSLSNGAFLRDHLLNKLPSVRFVPLYTAADSIEQSLSIVLTEYLRATDSKAASPAPFDVVVLGMGHDGHTASFFPDASNIVQLIDINQTSALLCCDSPSTQVPRVTWSLPMLLNTEFLALHFTGAAKRAVFDRAQQAGDETELPIRAVIHQSKTPLSVYYAE